MQALSFTPKQYLSTLYFNRLIAENSIRLSLATGGSATWSATQQSAPSAQQTVLVIAGQQLCGDTLVHVITELVGTPCDVAISANRYHQDFLQSAVNVTFPAQVDINIEQVNALSVAYHLDMFIKPNVDIDQPGLALFDMDSTIIEMECIDEIAKLAGVGEQVAAVTERAMRGEIAFADSLHHRVACLQGVDLHALLSIRQRLPFVPGFAVLVEQLQQQGWKVAIASGGFTYFADFIQQRFELDDAVSNTLEVAENTLTGKVVGEVIDAQAKARVLNTLSDKYQIDKHNTLAIGDGANDLVMMKQAGCGIAYRAKPAVQKEAQVNIRYSGLEAVLYVLG